MLLLSHSDCPFLCFFHVDIFWVSHALLTKLSSLISLHSLLCSVQPCSQVSCFVACMKCVHCSVRKRGRACVCTSHGVVVLLVIVLSSHKFPQMYCLLLLFKAWRLRSYSHINFCLLHINENHEQKSYFNLFFIFSPLEVVNEDTQKNVNSDGIQGCQEGLPGGDYWKPHTVATQESYDLMNFFKSVWFCILRPCSSCSW